VSQCGSQEGEYHWHKHDEDDEFFFVLQGQLLIDLEDRTIEGKVYLYSANDKFLPIEIKPFWQFDIQGVVKHVIHSV